MLDTTYLGAIEERINQKTKPLGSLGQLERVASQIALIQSQGKDAAIQHITIENPSVIVFAGDHGIADEGVSIAPSVVTQQMVLNFLHGGAAVNCFCRANDVDMSVVDCGMIAEVADPTATLILQRVGNGTANFAVQPAMLKTQALEAIELGKKIVKQKIEAGSNLVMFGEMGIANTSSAAALLAALSTLPVTDCVGRGTGISDEQFAKKVALIEQAISRVSVESPIEALTEFGGFEIAQMVGGFIAAKEAGVSVIVDGFIVSVSAYIATLIEPSCRDYMLFAHKSHESGHKHVLEQLSAEPLLDLELRLGEGTGAVLAVALIRSAAEFYNTMASFSDAGVTV